MNILVCVKHVPETAEADLKVRPDGLGVQSDDLVFDLNEWDLYAVEAALQLTEEHGGEVTAVTLGNEDAEDSLRRALAMGCQEGVHIVDEDPAGLDGHAAAGLLGQVASKKEYDLILCGVQAADDGLAWTGPALAARLDLPHATMVTAIEKAGDKFKVRRELEGGMEEELLLPCPCLLTIQTGINEPRYVSVMGIRKVRKKPLEVLARTDMEAKAGPRLKVLSLSLPPAGGQVEFLEGSPGQQAEALAAILAEKGGLK
ncbi:MAG: electron transfer flavoprotein subunit beta/FixA family protein [Desulfarculaceae bacterium]|jgi:electron transfer flavoprotein beta subunit